MLGRDGHSLSHWFGFAVIGVLLLGLGGCGSPEQRAQYHYERGVELAKEGELAKAALEFRNALKSPTKIWSRPCSRPRTLNSATIGWIGP